jgi:hypothetical protein
MVDPLLKVANVVKVCADAMADATARAQTMPAILR